MESLLRLCRDYTTCDGQRYRSTVLQNNEFHLHYRRIILVLLAHQPNQFDPTYNRKIILNILQMIINNDYWRVVSTIIGHVRCLYT